MHHLFLFGFLAVSAFLPSGLAFPVCHNGTLHRPSKLPSGSPIPSFTPTPSPPVENPVNPTTSSQPPPATTSLSQPANSSSGSGGTALSAADIQAALDAHNTVRSKHNASPLVWSEGLASTAQEWAGKCNFEHSQGQLGNFGENLAVGSDPAFSITDGVALWVDETYTPGTEVYNHYTQVVWKSTTDVGCGIHYCADTVTNFNSPGALVVCEYNPPGNVIGQISDNVEGKNPL